MGTVNCEKELKDCSFQWVKEILKMCHQREWGNVIGSGHKNE